MDETDIVDTATVSPPADNCVLKMLTKPVLPVSGTSEAMDDSMLVASVASVAVTLKLTAASLLAKLIMVTYDTSTPSISAIACFKIVVTVALNSDATSPVRLMVVVTKTRVGVGAGVGVAVGADVGVALGVAVGVALGVAVGEAVGVGAAVGVSTSVGALVGAAVGAATGEAGGDPKPV